jgi:hydroxypyruvate isomerase
MTQGLLSRRDAMRALTAGVAGTAALTSLASAAAAPAAPAPAAAAQPAAAAGLKGRIKQSVSRWCYGSIPWDDFCKACKEMGIVGVDLVGPDDVPHLQKYGLIPTCMYGIGSLTDALNNKVNHPKCMEQAKTSIANAKKLGAPNVITFSGNRRGISDEEGIENCALFLKEAAKMAEDAGVTIIVELLNSKVDHKDYQMDHTAWGVKMCKAVGSPNVKLLYDIYHMQIMEGDVIRTIRDNIQCLGHFHTGGNPGRHEIDDTQELNYPAIMRGIVDTGYKGFVAHEFVPTNKQSPLDSLRQAVKICDV